jgi:hypothetical protein
MARRNPETKDIGERQTLATEKVRVWINRAERARREGRKQTRIVVATRSATGFPGRDKWSGCGTRASRGSDALQLRKPGFQLFKRLRYVLN